VDFSCEDVVLRCWVWFADDVGVVDVDGKVVGSWVVPALFEGGVGCGEKCGEEVGVDAVKCFCCADGGVAGGGAS